MKYDLGFGVAALFKTEDEWKLSFLQVLEGQLPASHC